MFSFLFSSAEANSLKLIPPVPPPPKEYSIPVQIEKSPVKNVKINPSPKYYDAKSNSQTTDESSSFDEKIYKDERIVIIHKRPGSGGGNAAKNNNKSKLAEVILDEVNQQKKSSKCIKMNSTSDDVGAGGAGAAFSSSNDMDSLSSIETKVHQFEELVEKENNSGEFDAKSSNDFSDLNGHSYHFNGNVLDNFGSRNSSRPTSRMSSNYQSYQFSGKTHTIYF